MAEHKGTTILFRLDPVLGRYPDVIAADLEDAGDDAGDHGHDADVEAASTALAVGVHEMLRRLGRQGQAEELRRYMRTLHPGEAVVWGTAQRSSGGMPAQELRELRPLRAALV